MHFAEEHNKKGLKEMQANSVKVVHILSLIKALSKKKKPGAGGSHL
jgi:hypothetical protein